MTKKFTEEQYQKIVEIGNQYHDDRMRKTETLLDYVFNDIVFKGGAVTQPLDKAMAIANPLTRELAHNKYVEKEKKYVWESKRETAGGGVKRLYDAAIGITDSFVEKTKPTHNGNWITETDVRKWGYDPSKFTRIEDKGDI